MDSIVFEQLILHKLKLIDAFELFVLFDCCKHEIKVEFVMLIVNELVNTVEALVVAVETLKVVLVVVLDVVLVVEEEIVLVVDLVVVLVVALVVVVAESIYYLNIFNYMNQ